MTTTQTPDDFEIDWNRGADAPVTMQAAEPAPAGEPIPAPPADWTPSAAPARGDGRNGGRLAADLPAPLRQGIEARRARRSQPTETDAQRTAREAREATARAQAALDDSIRIALTSEDGTYPHGCLVAWHPSGVRTWSTIAAAAEAAGVSAPAQRSLRAIAADAVRAIERDGLRVETVKRGSEWVVYRPAPTAELGASIGDAHVLAQLVGEDLTVVGPDDLCAIVRDAFDAARREATIGSTEVTQWLAGILATWRAVPTAYGRWVPPGTCTESWLRLADALADAHLPVPRRPAGVMSRDDIREELRTGLVGEIESLMGEIQNDRDRALAAAKDLGARAAASALTKIADLRVKLGMYEMLTGPLTEERAALEAMATDLGSLTDETAQFGANLELDVKS